VKQQQMFTMMDKGIVQCVTYMYEFYDAFHLFV